MFDVNFAVGSIFGIYENEANARNLKAAVYSIYSARLELIICEQKSAPKLYRLNQNGEFVLVKELKIGEKGKINA